jgi:hypothetical protein
MPGHTLAVDLQTKKVYTAQQEADGKPMAKMMIYEAVRETSR